MVGWSKRAKSGSQKKKYPEQSGEHRDGGEECADEVRTSIYGPVAMDFDKMSKIITGSANLNIQASTRLVRTESLRRLTKSLRCMLYAAPESLQPLR
jgi:hypothetical protein